VLVIWMQPGGAVTCVEEVPSPWVRDPAVRFHGPLVQLTNGTVLVQADNRLLRLAPGLNAAEPIALPDASAPDRWNKHYLEPLPGGDALAMFLPIPKSQDTTSANLYLYEHDGKRLTKLNGLPRTRAISEGKHMQALQGGDVLIRVFTDAVTETFWRFDHRTRELRPVKDSGFDAYAQPVALASGDAILSKTAGAAMVLYKAHEEQFEPRPLPDGKRFITSVLALPTGDALLAGLKFTESGDISAKEISLYRYSHEMDSVTSLAVRIPLVNGRPVTNEGLPRWHSRMGTTGALLTVQESAYIVDFATTKVTDVSARLGGADLIPLAGSNVVALQTTDVGRLRGGLYQYSGDWVVDATIINVTTGQQEALLAPHWLSTEGTDSTVVLDSGVLALFEPSRSVLQWSPSVTKPLHTELTVAPTLSPNAVTRWKITGPCAPYLRRDHVSVVAASPGADFAPAKSEIYDFQATESGVSFAQNFDISTPGDWRFQVQIVQTSAGHREDADVAKLVPLHQGLVERLTTQWKLLTIVAVGCYFAVFTSLLVAAHWQSGALRIIGDPFWSKVGLLPWLLIGHLPAVQQWILEPWFQRSRAGHPTPRKHLPMPLRDADDRMMSSDELHTRINTGCRLLVQGNSGMGKTALAESLMQAYFTATSLNEAVRQRGHVLIAINVRRHSPATVDPDKSVDWILQGVAAHFAEHQFVLPDPSIVHSMLRSGRFILLLDGLNEVPGAADAVRRFATQFKGAAGIVATSQSGLSVPFVTLRLPPTMTSHVRGLLELHLGQEAAHAVCQRLESHGLLAHILNGYDVQLLIDLVKDRDIDRVVLPTTRVDLYREVLATMRHPDGIRAPLDDIQSIAWTMVATQTRAVEVSEIQKGGAKLFEALVSSKIPLVQVLGESMEFRHDQMRAFLAAEWLSENSPQVSALIARLLDSPIWKSGRRDQGDLWQFLALIIPVEWVEELWRFAASDPSRGYLQCELQHRAEREGLPLQL
jgi:hypothetical protein